MKPTLVQAAQAVATLRTFVHARESEFFHADFAVHFAFVLDQAICMAGNKKGHVFTSGRSFVTCRRCAAKLARWKKDGSLAKRRERAFESLRFSLTMLKAFAKDRP